MTSFLQIGANSKGKPDRLWITIFSGHMLVFRGVRYWVAAFTRDHYIVNPKVHHVCCANSLKNYQQHRFESSLISSPKKTWLAFYDPWRFFGVWEDFSLPNTFTLEHPPGLRFAALLEFHPCGGPQRWQIGWKGTWQISESTNNTNN